MNPEGQSPSGCRAIRSLHRRQHFLHQVLLDYNGRDSLISNKRGQITAALDFHGQPGARRIQAGRIYETGAEWLGGVEVEAIDQIRAMLIDEPRYIGHVAGGTKIVAGPIRFQQ